MLFAYSTWNSDSLILYIDVLLILMEAQLCFLLVFSMDGEKLLLDFVSIGKHFDVTYIIDCSFGACYVHFFCSSSM